MITSQPCYFLEKNKSYRCASKWEIAVWQEALSQLSPWLKFCQAENQHGRYWTMVPMMTRPGFHIFSLHRKGWSKLCNMSEPALQFLGFVGLRRLRIKVPRGVLFLTGQGEKFPDPLDILEAGNVIGPHDMEKTPVVWGPLDGLEKDSVWNSQTARQDMLQVYSWVLLQT